MTTNEKPQFLLLFRHPQEGPDPSSEEMERILGQWMDWIRGMKAKGQLRGTNRLQEAGKVLHPTGGIRLSDGPYAEAKEVVGGYVLIAAASLDEAVEIARGCPGLHAETTVEVRQVEPLPPL